MRNQFDRTSARCASVVNSRSSRPCNGTCTSAVEPQFTATSPSEIKNHAARSPLQSIHPALPISANISGPTTHEIRRM